MVGRTPEFLGKKIEAKEMKIAAIIALLHTFLISGINCIVFTFVCTRSQNLCRLAEQSGQSRFFRNAYTNSLLLQPITDSGFEGLGDNAPFWNIACGLVMLLAGILPIIGPVAIAGILAKKKYVPESAGTLKTDTTALSASWSLL